MSLAVERWPLRPMSTKASLRGSLWSRPRCWASAARVIPDADERRLRASRSSACARSSGRETVMRRITALLASHLPAVTDTSTLLRAGAAPDALAAHQAVAERR